MPVAIFGRNLKGLIPVDDLCLVASKDIPEILWDYVPCTYHLILFQRIKKGFGLSKVSTLTPTDTSGLMVWSTNIGTYKINAFTLKRFGRVQVKDKLKKARLFFWKYIFSNQLNVDSFEK